MAERTHTYSATVTWIGNQGTGTSSFREYSRNHEIRVAGKPVIEGSSDPAFRGDPTRYNPEEMLVISLSTCHMLWYLADCAMSGVIVTEYVDDATGEMVESVDGGGRFTKVVLRPRVTLGAGSDRQAADHAHHTAHAKCFISNSVNFPVEVEPTYTEV